jgi:hypothetical protein
MHSTVPSCSEPNSKVVRNEYFFHLFRHSEFSARIWCENGNRRCPDDSNNSSCANRMVVSLLLQSQNTVLAAPRTDCCQHARTRFSSVLQCLLERCRKGLVGCDQLLALHSRIDRDDRWPRPQLALALNAHIAFRLCPHDQIAIWTIPPLLLQSWLRFFELTIGLRPSG